MGRYDYSDRIHLPSPTAAFAASGAWMTFIAVAAASSLASATSIGDVATGLLMTIGAATASVVAFVLALRTHEDGPESWLGIPARPEPLPVSRRPEDRAA